MGAPVSTFSVRTRRLSAVGGKRQSIAYGGLTSRRKRNVRDGASACQQVEKCVKKEETLISLRKSNAMVSWLERAPVNKCSVSIRRLSAVGGKRQSIA